jgi:raffinose/stachyose/melibiose transport system substrate-binding protein
MRYTTIGRRGHGSFLRPRGAAVISLAAVGLVLAACSSGGSSTESSSGAPAPSSSGAAPTSDAPAEPVELWVQSGNGGADALLAGYEELNAAFEAANPGVTIKFEVKSFTELVDTLSLQLSGDDVPDVTQVNQGYGSLGQLVTAGLVAPMDDIATASDWAGRQGEALIALNGRFSPDGKDMGAGELYGVSATGAWVGLYINKEIAKSLGYDAAPTSLEEMEAMLAKAKDAGIPGLMFGATDGGEQIWLMANLLMGYTSPQTVTDVINGVNEQLPPEMLQAAETMQKWAEAGYLTEGWAALDSTEVLGMFSEGEGLFALNGSWNVFQSDTPEAFGLVPFPLASASEIGAIASGDLPWSVPTNAKNPDLAKKYIDFITSPEASEIWVNAGQVPATISGNEQALVEASGLVGVSADAILQWVNIMTNGTPIGFPDWATPTWYDTIAQSSTALMAGEITPQEFVDALQADYGAFTAERKAS